VTKMVDGIDYDSAEDARIQAAADERQRQNEARIAAAEEAARRYDAKVREDAPFRLRSWIVNRGRRVTYCAYERCKGGSREGTRDAVATRGFLRELADDEPGEPTGLPSGWVIVAESGSFPRPFCTWHHASLYAGRKGRANLSRPS
jgi:hypothetical protein